MRHCHPSHAAPPTAARKLQQRERPGSFFPAEPHGCRASASPALTASPAKASARAPGSLTMRLGPSPEPGRIDGLSTSHLDEPDGLPCTLPVHDCRGFRMPRVRVTCPLPDGPSPGTTPGGLSASDGKSDSVASDLHGEFGSRTRRRALGLEAARFARCWELRGSVVARRCPNPDGSVAWMGEVRIVSRKDCAARHFGSMLNAASTAANASRR